MSKGLFLVLSRVDHSSAFHYVCQNKSLAGLRYNSNNLKWHFSTEKNKYILVENGLIYNFYLKPCQECGLEIHLHGVEQPSRNLTEKVYYYIDRY